MAAKAKKISVELFRQLNKQQATSIKFATTGRPFFLFLLHDLDLANVIWLDQLVFQSTDAAKSLRSSVACMQSEVMRFSGVSIFNRRTCFNSLCSRYEYYIFVQATISPYLFRHSPSEMVCLHDTNSGIRFSFK